MCFQELRRSRSLSKNAEKAKREFQEIATGLIHFQLVLLVHSQIYIHCIYMVTYVGARQLGSPGSQGRNIAGRSLPGKEVRKVR